MLCALFIISGLALFLIGVIVGAVLILLLERSAPEPSEESPPPPVLDDP